MQDLEKLSLEEYLRKLGFDGETAEMMLTYTTNEIDKTALHEKIKFLISLGLEPRNIRIVVEEDITFMTEELSLIVKNAEVLKSYLIIRHIFIFTNLYYNRQKIKIKKIMLLNTIWLL